VHIYRFFCVSGHIAFFLYLLSFAIAIDYLGVCLRRLSSMLEISDLICLEK
jgi:hypothetical protein